MRVLSRVFKHKSQRSKIIFQKLNSIPINLLAIEDLSAENIFALFDLADTFKNNVFNDCLRSFTVTNLFCESSTRTNLSFELAARQLGATVLNHNMQHSAMQKGEDFIDSIHTLEALGSNIVIVRHSMLGAARSAAQATLSTTSIINAGDGPGQHPSQALLDFYTIASHFKSDPSFTWQSCKIAIVGDSKHSRVAASLLGGLKILGCENINLAGPQELMMKTSGVSCYSNLKNAVAGCNVVLALRPQRERWHKDNQSSLDEYAENFKIDAKILNGAADNVILMHPGPMLRNVDIDPDLLSDPRCQISAQIANGVLIRKAILSAIGSRLSHKICG